MVKNFKKVLPKGESLWIRMRDVEVPILNPSGFEVEHIIETYKNGYTREIVSCTSLPNYPSSISDEAINKDIRLYAHEMTSIPDTVKWRIKRITTK